MGGAPVTARERAEEPWAEDCLAYGPFEGDRDVDVTTLRDRIVTARKPNVCHECAEPIAPGDRIRSITETCDGEIGTFRFCVTCCKAMAASWEDDGKAIEERYRLGYERRALAKTEGR
jgi:hypothetical protein